MCEAVSGTSEAGLDGGHGDVLVADGQLELIEILDDDGLDATDVYELEGQGTPAG